VRFVVLGVLAIGAVMLASPRPTHACSCDYLTRVTPADGAVDVPLNVEIVVDTGPDGSPIGGPPPYVLTGPNGPVAVEVQRIVRQPTYLIDLVRPLAPLEPSTDYVLDDGVDSPSLRDIRIGFRTGLETDLTEPPAIEVGELELAHAVFDEGNSCGDEFFFVVLPFELPPESAAVDIFVDDAHYVITAEKIPWGLSSQSDSCGISIALEPEREYCFDVRARDLAGNLGVATRRCATVTACPNIERWDDFSYDLSNCNDPAPEPSPEEESSGCSTTTAGTSALPFATLLLLGLRRLTRRP
jgi:hypothetical protein